MTSLQSTSKSKFHRRFIKITRFNFPYSIQIDVMYNGFTVDTNYNI